MEHITTEQMTELQATERQARALAKYLRVSIRTARQKIAKPPFWLKRIYAMHQEMTPEQRASVEARLAPVDTYVAPTARKMTLSQYRGKVKRAVDREQLEDAQ